MTNDSLAGQWIGNLETELHGSARIDIEDRGNRYRGLATIFYQSGTTAYPGLAYEISLPKEGPHTLTAPTTILWAGGGVVPPDKVAGLIDQLACEIGETDPIARQVEATFSQTNDVLDIAWKGSNSSAGQLRLLRSRAGKPSEMVPDTKFKTWPEFRNWAVRQLPRKYIFRGQAKPYRLRTTFHRTWRKDIQRFINEDIQALYGLLVDKMPYPLQLGQSSHNTAFWSLAQHHGYPTPLLDWTFSPFVAAYFALMETNSDEDGACRIFVFDKVEWENRRSRYLIEVAFSAPEVVILEGIHAGNLRVGPQQGLFTTSNVDDIESFIKVCERRDGQSYLTAVDIPYSERETVMRELEMMGITYGSLFPGIDGICKDVKERLFRKPE